MLIWLEDILQEMLLLENIGKWLLVAYTIL